MIKKTFPKITSLNQTLFHVPFTSFHFLNDNTQPRFLSNNLCYNLQSWKHIHFFLLNRSTIFNHSNFIFTSKSTIRLKTKTLHHPNDFRTRIFSVMWARNRAISDREGKRGNKDNRFNRGSG